MVDARDSATAATPTVHLLCGLPGSGKSTVARQIVEERSAVRFTLDEWMLRLHGMRYDDPEYGHKAADCRELIWDTACQVLALGADVVLDWSQWSRAKRAEWARRAHERGYRVVLHYVIVDAEIAIERATVRTDDYTHQIDEAGVRHMVELLEPPTPDEGFEIVRHEHQ